MFGHLGLAWHMFKESRRKKKEGWKTYAGSAQEICSQIVKDCWNGKFFQASTGHFNQFWMRDFGFSVPSLLRLGYSNEVKQTLAYALDTYARKGKITTTIYKDKPIDVFKYSVDSLPLLTRSLRLLGDMGLISTYRNFLESQAQIYFNKIFDPGLGVVRKNFWFSSMKDSAKRSSSMYANCMVAVLKEDLKSLGLKNPFAKYNIKKTIKDKFWKGLYFLDDLSGKTYVSGDANVIPFFLGVFEDREMLKNAIESIKRARLNEPLPLKYTARPDENKMFFWTRVFTPNYEGNTVWTNLGFIYLALLKFVDKEVYDSVKQRYEWKIERKDYTVMELFNSNDSVYKTPFYHADTGMLWSAIFLTA
jgi:hypothetical protein